MRLALRAGPVAALFIAIDQLAKALIRTSLPPCREQPIVGCARLHAGPLTLANVVARPPPSWSMPTSPPWIRLQDTGTGYVLVRDPAVALGLALLGCALIVVYAMWTRHSSWVMALGVGLQAGGALSNLVDRLRNGAATDYINVTPTLTFNLADLFLFVGMVLAVAGIVAGLAQSPPAAAQTDRHDQVQAGH